MSLGPKPSGQRETITFADEATYQIADGRTLGVGGGGKHFAWQDRLGRNWSVAAHPETHLIHVGLMGDEGEWLGFDQFDSVRMIELWEIPTHLVLGLRVL